MSTRAVVGRRTATGFSGVYVAHDGSPKSLGAFLWGAYHGYFNRDIEAMLKFMVDDHPEGWALLAMSDLSLPPHRGHPHNKNWAAPGFPPRPMKPGSGLFTETSPLSWALEWAYAFGPGLPDLPGYEPGPTMEIWGRGQEEWRVVCLLCMAGREPDWADTDAYGWRARLREEPTADAAARFV
jgi:hypothetical protein